MDDERSVRRRRNAVGYAALAVLVVVGGGVAPRALDQPATGVVDSSSEQTPDSEPAALRELTCPTNERAVLGLPFGSPLRFSTPEDAAAYLVEEGESVVVSHVETEITAWILRPDGTARAKVPLERDYDGWYAKGNERCGGPSTMQYDDGITCPTDNGLVWIDSEEHFASTDELVDAHSHEPFTFDADRRLLSYTRDNGTTYAVLESRKHGGAYGVSIRHCQGEQPGVATGVAPLRRQVTLEIGHCWIEPISFEGGDWAVATNQQPGSGEGDQPGLTGHGNALRITPTEVEYVDDGGVQLTLHPVGDPRVELPGGGLCQ